MSSEERKSKALNGQGSLYETKNYNGHAGWIFSTTEWGPNGKRIRIQGFGHTKQTAIAAQKRAVKRREEKLNKRAEIIEQLSIAPTFNTYCAQWLDNKQPTLGDQTWRKYKADLNNHILPHIGKKRLDEMGKQDFHNLFYKTLAETGTSARFHAYKTFSFVMNTAFDEGLVEKNYLKTIATPTHHTSVKSEDDRWISYRVGISRSLQRWLAKPETPYHDHYTRIMMMYLGLRRGEVLGIEWNSIQNLHKKDKATLTVDRTLQRHEPHTGKKGFYIQPYTKTKTTRIIHLPEPWRKALLLEKSKNRVAVDPQFKNLVFLTPEGKHYAWKKHDDLWREILTYYVNLGRKEGEKYEKLPAEKYFRPHATRHVAASVLFDQGVPAQQAARILGHSTTKMTEYYTHFMEKKMKEGTQSFATGYGYTED